MTLLSKTVVAEATVIVTEEGSQLYLAKQDLSADAFKALVLAMIEQACQLARTHGVTVRGTIDTDRV